MKYIITLEENNYNEYLDERHWDVVSILCDTYEDLIKKYARSIYQSTRNPEYFRNVCVWKAESIELLPDTPELNTELERIRQIGG